MKTTLFFMVYVLYTVSSFAQIAPATPWIWMHGDNTSNKSGVYGTPGIAAAGNKPGARNYSTTWRDAAGNLWLFGGTGYSASGQGYLNDLWKYNPVTGLWTWVKGDNTTGRPGVYGTQGIAGGLNKPGASYSSVSWTDSNGNLWLFGGFGYGSASLGLLNSLWKYNPATNEWTWIKGSSTINPAGVYGSVGVAAATNTPGARYGSQTWVDAAGQLWLYGGYGYAGSVAGILNDLWKYDPASNQWTWVKGDNSINQPAVYGTKGVAGMGNKPGARYGCVSWQDGAGRVWLFGGYGYDETFAGNLNDMWRYDAVANQWTWIGGDKLRDQKAVFGVQGVAAAANKPGSRYVSSSWNDLNGELWLFGGYGYDAVDAGYLNDLWKFNTTTCNWTWVKGDNAIDQRGVYGTQGVPNVMNKSGARTGSVSWADNTGNFWLFGGYGYDGSNTGILNDLWKLNSNQLTLPVHLLQFSGMMDGNDIRLKWTAEETSGFSHYSVQRSEDGGQFTTIGMVDGINNSSRNDFVFSDRNALLLLQNKFYYRLQLVDKDGKFTYSKIIRFDPLQHTGTVKLFPNPAVESVSVSFVQHKKGTAMVRITDMTGKTVKQISYPFPAGAVSQVIEVSELSRGVYVLSVSNDGGVVQQRFIKH